MKDEKERACERGKKDREERERRRVEEVVKTKVRGRRIFRRREGVSGWRERERKKEDETLRERVEERNERGSV